ncbi:hypothetical protein ACSDR0_49075, partial [Streptosporangium sp. G11]|uniref:hypothetical protein n=1 Tax=Streptosporangium sp. G11 TaxID=3436926 RepID=UPI003EC1529F
ERALGRGRSPSRRVADPANVCGYRTRSIWHEFYVAVELLGEEATATIVDETLKTYGTDHPADFIVKIFDEILGE